MRSRSIGVKVLNLLLLLTVLVAAGDELLCPDLLCCDDERDSHEISVEASEAGRQVVPAEVASAEIVPVEEEHEDECSCCGLRSQRISLAAAKTTPTLEIVEDATAPHVALFVEPFPASHSSRGPPLIR